MSAASSVRTVLISLLLLVVCSPTQGQDLVLDHCACTTGSTPSDSTFTFRGRMSAWNGAPTFRIWRVGTNRMLGIRTVCLDQLELGELNPYEGYELWADFTVSAVTPSKPGVMQFICIRKIANPFFRKQPSPK
ncbi:MAG TPA: hypothetical protein VKG92_07090 [Flavobacteriales bacterium]|nr:hypothetical protein [Flavobacteriales bacterium]